AILETPCMNSVFATATGSAVSISPEALARARSTLSQAAPCLNDDVLSTSQSPLKSALSGAPVPVDPESLKVIKRKFADYDDDVNESPAKRHNGEELDYSSLFRRAGSGKAIKISDNALSEAKKTMGADENSSTEHEDAPVPSSSFISPMIAMSPFPAAVAAAAAAASTATTPLRLTPQSILASGRRRAQQQQIGGNQFKSPFNSPFRPPIVASPGGFASPLVVRPAAPAAVTPATPVTATASPLSRLCLNSPASSYRVGLTPISSLGPNSRDFTIRVKVTERSGAIASYGAHGESRFCCWLSDASEESAAGAAATTPAARLEAEAGGEAAERARAVLQYGKVYDICSGRLLVRRPTPDNPRGIVLFFDERTLVAEVSSPSSLISRPRHRSSLTPLSDVKKEGEIDVAGIVRAVSSVSFSISSSPLKGGHLNPSSSTTTSPSEGIPSIDVCLVDQRAALTITLPHEYSNVQLSPGDLLLVYRASARLVNGSGVLRVSAVRARTKLLINPESEEGRVIALGRWSLNGQWAAGGAVKISSIARIGEKIKRGGGGEREEDSSFVTKAMVSNIDTAGKETVEICVGCGEKLNKDTTPCNCAGLAGIRKSLQLDVDISDGTGLIRATAIGSVAEELVGVSTQEAVGMLRWNRDEWRNQCRRMLYESRMFKLKRDQSTPSGVSIVDVLPVPYAAYKILIGQKLDRKLRRE
ncbi:hypothetical protein PENTCL1PPCAC_13040, partial [Pristionchus entomophagus]